MEQTQQLLWKSDSSDSSESLSASMMSVTLGRAMTALLSARPRKLHDAVSRLSHPPLSSAPHISVSVSLDDALRFLHKYINDAAQRNEPLHEILVPMLENSLSCKDTKRGRQAMVLLNWLFQDDFIFQAIVAGLAKIVSTKDDRFIVLGWCTLVRALLDYETAVTQFPMNGIRERYGDLVKILSSCIPHLSHVVRKGSTLQDGYELPSRLAVSAADCFLALTEALTKKAQIPSNRPKLSDSNAPKRPVTLVSSDSGKKKSKPASESIVASNMEMENILWDHLEELIRLVQKLLAWSRKSRPLHAKGLEQVLKWSQEIKGHYRHLEVETGSKVVKTGALLLYSCWKHYGMLMHLEDQKFSQHYKELLDQYLAGIQFYTDNYSGGPSENKDGGAETRKFFLNCLCLLLGRLDSKKFESVVSEYGMRISQVLLPQLHSADDDVIDGVVCIFKAVIFKPKLSGSSLTDSGEVDAMLPLLIHLLDERDGTARAVVMLIAEYCLMSRDNRCIKEVLERLACGNVQQRGNALDVVSELIRMSSDSNDILPQLSWQDIANHLIERLEDEEIAIRKQASTLLTMIDPSLVLPALVHLVYSSDERLQSTASDACVGVLKYHSQNAEVICLLLDCLSSLSQNVNLQNTAGDVESKLESERVLRLIPEWSKSVQSWDLLIGPLIEKMFAEPSNATMVKFLSFISEHLAEAADAVLSCVLLHAKQRKEFDGNSFSGRECQTYKSDDSENMQQTLFEHLCPLLIIRMLPMRVFNDLNSPIIYGQLFNQGNFHDCGDINTINQDCVTALLLKRTFCEFEFNDVRKLAAELCGRIHPEVLIPVVSSQLEIAASSRDILKIKACLFSVCTSLVVRGRDSLSHPVMLKIRQTLETMLLWSSGDGDEVSKAQHGCIDCLALMICAELQDPDSFSIVGKKDSNQPALSSDHDDVKCTSEGPAPLSFYMCMANVLISACQKILDSGRKPFARKTIPCLIHSVKVMTNPEIRAACVEVLFSSVYHLKSAILPYSTDLLEVSLKALRKGSEKEKMAGAKLMGSLMASDDAIVESISARLIEARSILSSIALTDASAELRQVCGKLLACLTP
ncbi:hypothetical protein D8674_026669 [Pyrus ussuriensis x Pyrus communis]|uniref:Uncharacterized protein n=1 Tax=Pyrus ussuriensis x Pyrus communis TaxID=2448454 RepID=A0A5N5I7G8_9ROSA|nr:hypothetical protein D8674_026669 [Pyrus ussuriensis x Pyrus communis]